jgi:hypothetical protein
MLVRHADPARDAYACAAIYAPTSVGVAGKLSRGLGDQPGIVLGDHHDPLSDLGLARRLLLEGHRRVAHEGRALWGIIGEQALAEAPSRTAGRRCSVRLWRGCTPALVGEDICLK